MVKLEHMYTGDSRCIIDGADDSWLVFDSKREDLVVAIATLPHEAFGWLLGQLQWIAAEAGGFQPDSQAALRQLAPLITVFFEASQKPDVGEPASSSGLPSVNQWRREG